MKESILKPRENLKKMLKNLVKNLTMATLGLTFLKNWKIPLQIWEACQEILTA